MNLRSFVHAITMAVSWVGTGIAVAQAPTIIAQPQPVTTYTGYPALLSVTVESPGSNPGFQWYLNGVGALPGSFTNVTGATNASLRFSHLTLNNSGAYFAIITNPQGAVTSAPVNLVVLPTPIPALNFGEIVDHGDGTASIPIHYSSAGTETNLAFSVTFDPTVFAEPRFQAEAPGPLPMGPDGVRFGQAADAIATVADGTAGAFGVTLTLTEGRVYPAGELTLGRLIWTLTPGRQAQEGRVGFSPSPIAVLSQSITNGLVFTPIVKQAPPLLIGRTVTPRLDRQSGLYLQPLTLANPGNADLTNALVTVVTLPVDSRTNQIVAYNALNRVGANALIEVGLVPAGTTRDFIIEYFVPDHQGWPLDSAGAVLLPGLSTSPGLPQSRTVPVAVPLADAAVRVTRQSDLANAAFTGVLLDFPTRTDRSYYIQYSSQADFSITNGLRLVLPPLPGTGSTVQWIDNGPPKTTSLPNTTTSRFYRVLEVR